MVITTGLAAAALVLAASLGGSVLYFVCSLEFLVVFALLLASSAGSRRR
jgi:hypothetical protein